MKKPLVSKTQTKRLIAKHGSPLYVYRTSVVERQYKNLVRSIPYSHKRIFYACKANANIEILRHLKKFGASIECVSKREVERALRAGFSQTQIAYTCSNIAREELLWIMRKGVSVHLDSLTQLRWWGEASPGSKVSLRVNRGFGAGAHSHIITGGPNSKFGIYYTDLGKARAVAKQYDLKIVGLQQHIGSSILRPTAFIRAMRLILASAEHFPDLEYIDLGGGLGIPYQPHEKQLDIKRLGEKMSRVFANFCRAYGRDLELRLEPGRYIVAESGALLTAVTDIKKTPGHTFIGVDSGMGHLIRPALYGAYHHIFNLSNPRGKSQKVNVVGNICESGDVFAKKRPVPNPRIGDLLLFADAGAYSYVMSSEYNLRQKPKEIVIR